MSEPVRITVTVTADGQVNAQTHDTVGEQCLPYIQVLEDMLDAATANSEYTSGWWKTAAAQVNTQQNTYEPAPTRLEDTR